MKKKIRIVTIWAKSLGDTVWAEPIIRSLTKKYKKVIVYTTLPALFENYPYPQVYIKDISKISIIKNRAIKYMCIFNRYTCLYFKFSIFFKELDYTHRRNQPILQAYSNIAHVPYIEEYPKIYLTDKEKQEKIWNKKYILIHLTEQAEPFRNIYGINWESIIETIRKEDYEIFYIQNKATPLFLNKSKAHPLTVDLRSLIVWIYQASYFIGMDSGPSHVAAALQTPSLIIFNNAVYIEHRHYIDQFKGVILSNKCKHRGCYDYIHSHKKDCLLASTTEYLQCCIFSTEQVLKGWETLKEKYTNH